MPDLFRHPPSVRLDIDGRATALRLHAGQRFHGTLYVGVTSDLTARLWQHREGIFGVFTSRHAIRRLVWFEMNDTMEAAIAAEKRIKRRRREWKMNLIKRDNPGWQDLAVQFGFPPLHQG